MATEKPPEWKTIMDADAQALANRTAKLREARLAHEATLPPPEPAAPKRVRKARAKPAAASSKAAASKSAAAS